ELGPTTDMREAISLIGGNTAS
ncbi:MAG: hypothetical protein K0S81_3612, partial [Rhodospirillales bacterium]|nr:hypothetical protein [Rhodospirillales bacterium]